MRTEIIMGVALVAAFIGGYQFAAALYGNDIAELRADYATRAQSLEVKYREKERGYAQSLVDAWEVRDAALARASDLSGDFERERLARCSGLVVRGAELVKRGVELSERTAIDKDALTKIVTE